MRRSGWTSDFISAPLHGQSSCPSPWTLEETLRIGSIDEDDALTGVLDMGIASDGEIFVTQPRGGNERRAAAPFHLHSVSLYSDGP